MIKKLEIKIGLIKKKINTKALAVISFMIFGAVSIFAMEMTNNFKRQKQQTEDSYNKSLYEIVGYIQNVEVELAKLQLTNTTRLTSTTLASIWKQANLAKENLEILPLEQNKIANASKFLSQVSDYSYALLNKTVNGDKIPNEDYTTIKGLYEDSKELSNIMGKVYKDLNTGSIKWDEVKKEGNEELENNEIMETASNVASIGKNFQEYEGLIYDGAFSDHILSPIPKFVENEKECSKEQAKEYIIQMFGSDNIEKIEAKEDSNGKIPLYSFSLKIKKEESERNIFITKAGCKLYLMIGDRKVKQESISMDEAKEKARDFLKKIGYENMQDTYYLKTENMAIINYAPVEDRVICYPDLIKVKVALDTGEVYSIEAQGYIFNHTKRWKLNEKHSIQKAKEVINKNIEVQTGRLAIIPTESKNEILTYEFKGKLDSREFLIYINAENLQEEKILLILNTPGGILTM